MSSPLPCPIGLPTQRMYEFDIWLDENIFHGMFVTLIEMKSAEGITRYKGAL